MFIVITGNPNVGKTTILEHLNNKGYLTYNVDQYVNSLYQFGRVGYDLILQEFGPEFVNSHTVDKKKLGDLIAVNQEAREKLQKLIWPIIRNHLCQLKKIHKDLIVEMAIFKINPEFFYNIFDFVIDVRRKNDIMINTLEKNKFNKIFKQKNNFNPDFIVNNDWSLEYTLFVVDKLFDIIY